MKKILSAALLAALLLCLLVPAMAEGVKIGQVEYAAHGTKCFAVLTVAMQDDVIADAYIDEFQFMDASCVGVPNSDAGFGESFPEGKVLGSKRVNAEYYSNNMATKAGSTISLDANYEAIEAFVVGKTIAELEAAIDGKTAEETVDVVSGCTLVDTLGYLQGIIAAAKAAQ